MLQVRGLTLQCTHALGPIFTHIIIRASTNKNKKEVIKNITNDSMM